MHKPNTERGNAAHPTGKVNPDQVAGSQPGTGRVRSEQKMDGKCGESADCVLQHWLKVGPDPGL